MRADLVVILLVRVEQMAKVPLTKDSDMIKTVSPDRTDEPFRTSVLPRGSSRSRVIPYAHGPNTPDEGGTIRAIAITNDISWRFSPTTRLGQLVGDPFSTWMCGHSQP